MINNCEGCFEELNAAFEYQEEGLHLATVKGDMSENIGSKGHFGLIMVDDNGKIKVS